MADSAKTIHYTLTAMFVIFAHETCEAFGNTIKHIVVISYSISRMCHRTKAHKHNEQMLIVLMNDDTYHPFKDCI